MTREIDFRTLSFLLGSVLVIAGCNLPESTHENRAEAPFKPRLDILGTAAKVYSQRDEDLIIRDFFQDRRSGFFLDVGCAWPVRNSTSCYLERGLGWSGIAVDALDIYRPLWEANRPNSKFFNYAVSDRSGEKVTFYRHDWSRVSSLIKEQSAQFGGEEKLTEIEVETITLTDLLDANGISKIDHLTLDIEGAEPGALRGFDIDRFRPELVCIEAKSNFGKNIQFVLEYFGEHGYERIDKYLSHDPVNWYFRRVR